MAYKIETDAGHRIDRETLGTSRPEYSKSLDALVTGTPCGDDDESNDLSQLHEVNALT